MTKLEQFINKYQLRMEITITTGNVEVCLGKEKGIRLYCYNSESLDRAIDNAINDYSGRFLK